jgi:hypothetical protein
MRDLAGRRSGWVVALLFIALGAQVTLHIREQSQTFDETIHLFSGYQYWQHRDFGANTEHPPLVKLAAALPLLFSDLKPTVPLVGTTRVIHMRPGVEFLYRNTRPAADILFEARLGASVFTLLLALLVLLAAGEMGGAGAGLIALTLLVFDPNILANAPIIANDMALTTFMFAAVFAYYRYTSHPAPGRLLTCGLAVGLALVSKHTAILLVIILPLLAAVDILLGDARGRPFVARATRAMASLGVIAVVALMIVWTVYTFRYAARPDGFELSPSLADQAGLLQSRWKSTAILTATKLRLLPEGYLWGLAEVFRSVQGRPTYLLGTVYHTGQWFYFPAVFLMKSTLGLLVLLAAAPFVLARTIGRNEAPAPIPARAIWFLVIPPVVLLAMSMTTRLNIGFRHILAMVPFLVVLAAATAVVLARRSRSVSLVLGIVVAAHIVSSLRTYPHYLTYSNEIVGGPSKTHRAMTDANVDWGQGMLHAANYLSARGIRVCWFVPMLTHVDPRDLGIPCRLLQGSSRSGIAPPHPAVVEGTVLVSASELSGQNWGPGELSAYGFLADSVPDAIIANSILVFSGRFEVPVAAASNRARRAEKFLADSLPGQAIEEAREAIAITPSSAEAQAMMCQVFAAAGRKPEALPYCAKAVEIADRVYPEYQYRNITTVWAAKHRLRAQK